MDIPDLVREELGDEEILAGVSIGDEDVVCTTPTRTIVYRSEGLISDERVDAYPHEADRLQLSEGRRKSKFLLDYMDGTRSFSVPSDHTRDVLSLVLEGILGAEGLIDHDESVVGAFRFSEMTLVIAERSILRHIGATVWDEDYEKYRYDQLTGLEFETGSVATELVISIDGRPQRIKIPREDARLVEETVKTAVCSFHDVESLEELRRVVAPEDEEPEDQDKDDLALGPDIDPLVTDDEADVIDAGIDDQAVSTSAGKEDEKASTSSTATADEQAAGATEASTAAEAGTANVTAGATNHEVTAESIEAALEEADIASNSEVDLLREQVADLSTAVKRQNELLKKQHGAIQNLVEQLRNQ